MGIRLYSVILVIFLEVKTKQNLQALMDAFWLEIAIAHGFNFSDNFLHY